MNNYLCPLHCCSWFLEFRLVFHQSLTFWLETVLKETPFPFASMPAPLRCPSLHWVLPPLSFPFLLALFLNPIPLSPGRISFSLPLFQAPLFLSIQSWLGSLCPGCCRVRMCSSVSQVCELGLSKAGPSHTIFHTHPKHYLSEAKCSFWITHSVVMTLREGLIAGSALPCQDALSSDLRPSLLNHCAQFAAWLQRVTWLGYPRRMPQGLHTVGQ